MAMKARIEEKIAGKKVMVFSKSYDPFSASAKKIFEKYIKEGKLYTGDYEVWDIEDEENLNEILDILLEKSGVRSAPHVFIKGKYFGGGDEVYAADRSGKLMGLIA